MQAHLIVTSLDEKEWQGCLQRLDYHTQRARVCGRKIYSHAAISFTNVDDSLARRAMRYNVSRSSAHGFREIIFEMIQQPKPDGTIGFSTLNDSDGWYSQWSNPIVYYYEIDPKKIQPMTLFLMCEMIAKSGLTYDWDWAVQAAYCPFLPCGACKCNCNSRTQLTTNCVGAVAICLAAAIHPDALHDRRKVREILNLWRPHPELYFPSEMLTQLLDAELIRDTPCRELNLRISKSAPFPPLLIRA